MKILEAIKQAIVASCIFGHAVTSAYADCTCTEIENIYHFVTKNTDDIPYMEDFPWAFDSCRDGTIYVTLVYEDNPHLDTYYITDDGNGLILWPHTENRVPVWIRFEDFEATVESYCTSPLS